MGVKIGEIPGFAKSPLPGLRVWKNISNQVYVMRLHYTADPFKRTNEWRRATEAGMTKRDWKREYEIDFTVPIGDPVFLDEFSYNFHVSPVRLKFDNKYPLLLGWDFGLSPACSFSQFLPGPKWNILDEIWLPRGGIERLGERVKMKISLDFGGTTNMISFIDPAGFTPSEIDETSAAEALDYMGFQDIRPGAVAFEDRRRMIALILDRAVKGEPLLKIDPFCHIIITGFQGGYHYPERITGRNLTKAMQRPVKNEFSHLMDTLQMVATGMMEQIAIQKIDSKPDVWSDGWSAGKAIKRSDPWAM